jgi:hypothetical protein
MFRRQFGADVAEQANVDFLRARSLGVLPGLRSAILSVLNIVGMACAERIRPTWHGGLAPRQKGIDMSNLLDQWRLDLVFAGRWLRRSPGFATVAIVTLALAIGVTSAIFSVVNTVLIRPLPYGDNSRLMFIGSTAPGSDMPPEFGVSAEFVVHYRDRSKLLEDVSLIQSFTSTIRVHDRVERVRMAAATYQLFSTLGAKPVLGTLPGANDAASSAVISHVLWQTWFDGRDDVIGQTHFMGDGNRTIVGVLGPDSATTRRNITVLKSLLRISLSPAIN